MTSAAALATADLGRCFDLFEQSAFRLETLPAYAVAAEDERLRAFRLGLPRPERSVRTSPWLARIATTTAAGKSWSRVRILGRASNLTEYQRYQLIGYQESAVAGDVISIADASAHPELADLDGDFWLFDGETDEAFAALMSYDADGQYIGSEIRTDAEAIEGCRDRQAVAEHYAVPLAVYLAELEHRAA